MEFAQYGGFSHLRRPENLPNNLVQATDLLKELGALKFFNNLGSVLLHAPMVMK
jgi:hypothetical protein